MIDTDTLRTNSVQRLYRYTFSKCLSASRMRFMLKTARILPTVPTPYMHDD